MLTSKFADLTATLTEDERDRLHMSAVMIGATDSDLELFVESVWRKPVTPRKLQGCIVAFKKWYEKETEGHEQHTEAFKTKQLPAS